MSEPKINFDKIEDSGGRTQFDTGSQRDIRTGKGRFDLISPIFLKRLAVHMEKGALKYKSRNWELGQPVCTYWDSAVRHLLSWLEGSRNEDHLAAAAFNIQGIIHTEEMVARGILPDILMDNPNYIAENLPDSSEDPIVE